MLKVRTMVTPYLSGHNTIVEWSQYHIGLISVITSSAVVNHKRL